MQIAIGLTLTLVGSLMATLLAGTTLGAVSIAMVFAGIGCCWDATGDMEER